jgi:hypothetical protein
VQIEGVKPKEDWNGNKPDVLRLHVFGLRAFARVPDKKHNKLAVKSLTCTARLQLLLLPRSDPLLYE